MAGDDESADPQVTVRLPRWSPEQKARGSGGSSCPKCGFAGLPKATPPENDYRVYVWIPAVDAQRWLGPGHGDVIVVACRRCNYRWIEAPADSTDAAGPN